MEKSNDDHFIYLNFLDGYGNLLERTPLITKFKHDGMPRFILSMGNMFEGCKVTNIKGNLWAIFNPHFNQVFKVITNPQSTANFDELTYATNHIEEFVFSDKIANLLTRINVPLLKNINFSKKFDPILIVSSDCYHYYILFNDGGIGFCLNSEIYKESINSIPVKEIYAVVAIHRFGDVTLLGNHNNIFTKEVVESCQLYIDHDLVVEDNI